MGGTLFDILLALCAVVLSQVIMAVYLVLAFLGSASFGKQLLSRVLSRIGAGIMLAILAVEFCLFQFVARPAAHWSVLGMLLSGLVLWTFLMTAFTDPGTPASPEWRAWHAKHGSDEIQRDNTSQHVLVPDDAVATESKRRCWAPGEICFCEQCKHPRPERSHHCKVCDCCVLRMDHHCPLIGNCVGWRNHKYYVLLQWWQFWACAVFLFAPGGPGELAIYGRAPMGLQLELLLYTGVAWAGVVMMITVKTFAVAASMAARNETHIEALYPRKNPYKLHVIENLKQLMGPLDFLLLLPVACSRTCTGTSFPVGDQQSFVAVATLKGGGKPSADDPSVYGSV